MSNILLGVTGSVAAIRTPALVAALRQAGHDVRVVTTHHALYFFDPGELGPVPLIRDEDEWPGQRWQRDEPVLHIELRRWADLLLIAPLDANTLAKLAYGLSDNCLTCVWRAWDPARPVVLAPAMNTLMWQHPLTRRHLTLLAPQPAPAGLDEDALVEWLNGLPGPLRLVAPQSKRLACGDVGIGAMAEVADIVALVRRVLPPYDEAKGPLSAEKT
jgi:phosphopantothenoylcysteine decarboxylase